MDPDKCCYGHGPTHSAFLGRSVGAALAGSAALPAAADADPSDGQRSIPRPGQIPDTPLARAVASFAAGDEGAVLVGGWQISFLSTDEFEAGSWSQLVRRGLSRDKRPAEATWRLKRAMPE